MSSIGYPDFQKIAQWIGAPIVQQTGLALGNGVHDDGPFNLASWASVVVAIKPTGGKVTVTVKQKISGGPATLELDTTFTVDAGATVFESIVLFGDAVTLHLAGDTIGETVDYALFPSNATTNAQLSTNPSIGFQLNDVLVATEPALDFEDAGGFKWSVLDDAAGARVKVTPPKIITGRVSGAGAIQAGTGFSVVRNSVGNYTVTYSVAWPSVPVLLVQGIANPYITDPYVSTVNAFTLSIFHWSTGNNTDNDFNFLAIACA
jgi:hypothetical protein